jgi:succinate-semialdehyde dehydrogenase/glutarate-semialdehyde dehydrogenase
MAIASINPTTGEILKTFGAHDAEEIEHRLQQAEAAFQHHRRRSFEERAQLMTAAAFILDSEKEHFSEIITSEMGKIIRDARAEVEKCSRVCRFYAQNAERFLEDNTRQTQAARSFVRYQPMGAILAIMPWNYPFWQVFRFAAPALMAGNVGLLKHAANVPQCALAIEDIFVRAGFPGGSFLALLVEAGHVEKIIADRRVKAVTLTGSERAGSAVAAAAGRDIKKCVLELGGNDPFIVMSSADIDSAIETAVKARTTNSGQSCIAAKRFLVADSIYDKFLERFVAAFLALKIGDPMDEATDVGPLTTEKIRDGVDEQVQKSVAAGAKLLTGGNRVHGPGYFYEPTILTNVPPGSPAYEEEIFGPVASVFRIRDSEEAIELANDSVYGLGASVWTNDPAEQALFTSELEVGMVFFNAMVLSDPRLPFGGVKRSGFGRELGDLGIREFMNAKTIWVA